MHATDKKTAVTFCAFPLRGRKSRQLFLAEDAGVTGNCTVNHEKGSSGRGYRA